MKSLWVAVLSTLLILGVGAVAIAQQTQSPASAPADQAKPADDKATGKAEDSKATTPPGPSRAPSASVDVNIKGGDAASPGVEGSASPRTERPARIFGLDPTAAALIGAGILIVVIIALVAMARSDGTTRTNIDLDRRL
jgi:hypothetical protein